ncbi:MAG: hypothetical protein HQL43_08980, partial [Alphaproteobacteria bacterium]|nr:hypothetical protein [Alphaproteobacteria bacterium]
MRPSFLIVFSLLACLASAPLRAESETALAELMLASAPAPSEIAKLSGTDGWWPEPPEFLGRLDPATGLRTLIMQSFRLPEPGTRDRIMLALSAYASAESAAARFSDMEPDDNRNFGSTHVLLSPENGQMRLHVAHNPKGQSLRVQKGRYILRLTHWSDGPHLSVDQMTELSDRTLERLNALERGRLKRPARSSEQARHLPLSSPGLGAIMGTASGPMEWAAFDHAEGENIPDPDLLKFLEKHMRPQSVALRRWPLLNTPGGQVVDALLFSLADRQAAQAFMALDRKNRTPERLVLAPLPQYESHLEGESGEYGGKFTLTFAVGRT